MGTNEGPGYAPENPFVSQASYEQLTRNEVIWDRRMCKILFIGPIRPGTCATQRGTKSKRCNTPEAETDTLAIRRPFAFIGILACA